MTSEHKDTARRSTVHIAHLSSLRCPPPAPEVDAVGVDAEEELARCDGSMPSEVEVEVDGGSRT